MTSMTLTTVSYTGCCRPRRGIPVALAVLWMELAQGLGLAVRGVLAFQGIFLVKVNLPMGQVVMDPMDGPITEPRGSCPNGWSPFRRQSAVASCDELGNIRWACICRPHPSREIIARMLRNLKEIHTSQKRLDSACWQCKSGLVVLLPDIVGRVP
jgi:regulator of sirC expression with transglutaminase-like and TPR domain